MAVPVQLTDPHACERFYDDRYAQGYMDAWPLRKLERVRRIIAELRLPATGTAVDFGCGNGLFTALLLESLPGWRVVGLEISRTAIDRARRTIGGCEFHHVDNSPVEPGSVHFLFSHHVLEHAADLATVWESMTLMMDGASKMLHILPCGNPGSFEHELCTLRAGGIDPRQGGRFFYEDESHLRRLTTEQMAAMAARHGFRIVHSVYSHHQRDAVDWLTDNGSRFVRDLCDPGKAIDEAARRKLKRLRRRLLPRALVKSLARRRSLWLRPASAIAERLCDRWEAQADREWQTKCGDPAGSEMYLAFRRE